MHTRTAGGGINLRNPLHSYVSNLTHKLRRILYPRLLSFLFILTSIFMCRANAVVVGTVGELVNAINDANAGGDKLIECENGTYPLTDLLHIIADSMTVRSLSGNRDSVIIRGQGMNGGVSHVFLVQGSDFTARDLTIGWVANHAIQIQGEQNADRPFISNVRFVDTYEQMLKVSAGGAEFCDSGVVEYCLFEYTAGIGPQYYIGGVDCHRSRNWIVRNNVFKYIRSPGGSIAEHAIHFWNNSENTVAECNWIINCDRGIGFGLGSSQHIGGIIRNNMIYHDTTEGFADVGISLETCPDGQVYNNTIYHEHGYLNAIEYRFTATTNAYIANNLTNRNIQARDGATGIDTSNITNAQSSWFIDIAAGDLHLDYTVSTVVDQGIPVTGLTQDFDGDPRPYGAGYDIGADEYTGTGLKEDPRSVIRDIRYNMSVSPNPFSKLTTVSFGRRHGAESALGEIALKIYDADGRLVKELFLPTTYYLLPTAVSWDGTDSSNRILPSGVYYIRLESCGYNETEQVILLK
jgi:hypothetical protein